MYQPRSFSPGRRNSSRSNGRFGRLTARARRSGRGTRTVLTLAIAVLSLLIAGTPLFAAGVQEEEPDQLTVYTYDAFPEVLEDLIVEHFEAEYGIAVDLQRQADTGGLYNQLFLERNNPQADVAIGLDTTYLGQVIKDELLEPYKPERADAIPENLIVDEQFRAIPFDYGGIVLNYDSEAIDTPPTDWDDLTDERFRDSIIVMNPNTSSPGRNFLLHTIYEFGEDGFLDYWERLAPNILTVTPGWSEGYGLYTEGEAPIVLSYETSPAFHIEFEDEDRYRPLIFNDEAFYQIEVMGIVRGTQRREAAEKLIEYVLSEEFQQEIPLSQFMYPVREDIELPASFGQIDRAERSVSLDPSRVAENIDDWLQAWEDVMR